MPPEWGPHEGTWLAWPHEARDWPGKFALIPWTYAEIVRQLGEVEAVEVLTQGRMQARGARRILARSHVDMTRVRFHSCATDRSWIRDSGPTFVRRALRGDHERPRVGLVHWKFNAWAKYDDWARDRCVPDWVAQKLELPIWRARSRRRWVVCEGGAIDVDGSGLLLATEECLLSSRQARNPGLGRRPLERTFRDYLGVEEVVWLRGGIAGDDTHGHVDDVARFVGPRQVVAVETDDPNDPNFGVLQANLEILKGYRTRKGERLKVRVLPLPRPIQFRGQRLPASYANFYVANRKVIVPTFDDPSDGPALDVLRLTFPGREIVGIRARDLVWGLGTFHCLTQQQPAVPTRTS